MYKTGPSLPTPGPRIIRQPMTSPSATRRRRRAATAALRYRRVGLSTLWSRRASNRNALLAETLQMLLSFILKQLNDSLNVLVVFYVFISITGSLTLLP